MLTLTLDKVSTDASVFHQHFKVDTDNFLGNIASMLAMLANAGNHKTNNYDPLSDNLNKEHAFLPWSF